MKKFLVMLLTLVMISSVFTLIACTQQTEKSYTVTFDCDGGTPIESQVVQKGQKILLDAAPTKDSDHMYSYAFDGWYNGDALFD
ncbi:MAG: InlB B-repeat-containing protein, partial [Clostridia bacterium]|nr:InlB B-repeat-containing protein [Clostridia bacterium]